MRNTEYIKRASQCGLLFLLLLSGCTKTSLIPIWRLTPGDVYPPATHLSAIGEGDTRQMAEINAAANLSRLIEADITSDENHFGIEPDPALFGVQFNEPFVDINRRVHIAAFIQRNEAATIYKKKINKAAADILNILNQSARTDEPLRQYALHRAATLKAHQNDQWIAQLRIITPQAEEAFSLPYDPQEIYEQSKNLAHDITFNIDVKGDAASVTEKTLKSTLIAMGFSQTRNHATLSFSGTADYSKSDLHRGSLIFMRYKIDVEAKNKNGLPVVYLHKSSHAAHISFDEAQKRAERMIRADLPLLTRHDMIRLFNHLTEDIKK